MDLRESITNQTNVSLFIANHLFSKQSHQDKNIVYSPLSLQVVLSIIAAGADGPTLQQLLDFLRFKSTDHLNSFVSHLLSVILQDDATPSYRHCLPLQDATLLTTPAYLSFANGVWVEQSLTLQPSFKQIVTTDYKATLASVDFQNKGVEVTNEVNLWVEKETNGLIKEILPQGSVNHLTRLIFANALYFKGAWVDPFYASKTKDYDFHLLNGNSIKVPFMTSKKDRFIRAFDGFKVLRIPYKQGKEDKRKFSMYFFLPNANDGLSALVEKVASESELLNHKLLLDKVEVGDFRIPKFNISFELETSDMLKELGVVLPFYGGGLTKLVNSNVSQELHVSDIFHKSFIKVNENGTEAAAATGATMKLRCAKIVPTRLDFVADHPFLFMIREDMSGTILFVGWVLNPLTG